MILVGDLHGGHPALLHHIKRLAIKDDVIIQVGDWGLGFNARADDINMLRRIDKFLEERNIKLYIIRGNHDNKWFWDHYEQLALNVVRLVNDYEVLPITGHNVMFVGGGISIDRLNRTPEKDYWADEVFVFNEIALNAACNNTIDIVVSHISPSSCWPYMLTPTVEHYIQREKIAGRDLRSELAFERNEMEKILRRVKSAGAKEWYYGHYHQSVAEEIDNMRFKCLDIGELFNRS